mmetsp:Transcript_16268/g.50933  ORF Transcript_16268/g.50933 Transcript_16268/m.50933 type:complete len:231 (-) Transcript_16268:219-911(-)
MRRPSDRFAAPASRTSTLGRPRSAVTGLPSISARSACSAARAEVSGYATPMMAVRASSPATATAASRVCCSVACMSATALVSEFARARRCSAVRFAVVGGAGPAGRLGVGRSALDGGCVLAMAAMDWMVAATGAAAWVVLSVGSLRMRRSESAARFLVSSSMRSMYPWRRAARAGSSGVGDEAGPNGSSSSRVRSRRSSEAPTSSKEAARDADCDCAASAWEGTAEPGPR